MVSQGARKKKEKFGWFYRCLSVFIRGSQLNRSGLEPQLLPNDLHKHPLASASIKLAVKNLFPGTKIQFAFGDGNHDFPSHNLPLHVSVGVVFPGPIMLVLGGGGMRRQFLEPHLVIVVQTAFVVVDK